jgi:branched-chain amino acid transport system substrate-binding protein
MKKIFGLALVAAFLAASCNQAPATLVIGAIYPTGGSQGSGGLGEYRGASLAADLANRDGGVRGRKIELRLFKADSAEAAPGAARRLASSGIRIWLGSYGSTISARVAAQADKLGALFWETGAVGELPMFEGLGRRVFRFPPTGAQLGADSVTFIRDRYSKLIGRGNDLRYTVVYVDDVYGRSVARGAIDEINRSGLDLAATIPYTLPGAGFDQIAAKIAAARTDVLVVSAYVDDAVAMRKAILKAKVPLVAGIGTSSSYCMPEFGERLGAQAVGLFASDKPDGDVLKTAPLAPPAAKALEWGRSEYRRRYHQPMSGAALTGFSGAWALFKYVLPNARSLTPAAVAAAAAKVNLPKGSLPNGSGLRFAPPGAPNAGDNLRAASVIWEWTTPGWRAVVWPPEFATEPITPLTIN